MTRTKMLLTALAATGLTAGSASAAAITVVDSYTDGRDDFTLSSPELTATISEADLGLTGTADKLVVGFTQRRNGDVTATYGGVALVQTDAYVVSGANNDGTAAIFYLDDPTLAGDLVLTSTSGDTDFQLMSLFAFALSGTADGGPIDTDTDTSATLATLASVTTGADGGFVIGAMGINGGGDVSSRVTITADPLASKFYSQSSIAAWNTTAAATYELGFSAFNDSAVSLAAFAPVPEPSSLALLGLGGLCVLRRRRA